MRKYKFFISFEKEEVWLNKLAKQGWLLESASSGGYKFFEGPPQDVNYRIDFRTFKNKAALAEYVQLFEDTGWRHIAGTRYSGAQYFAPLRPDASDDIFSDDASRAGRYRRSNEVWLSFLLFYTVFFVVFALNGFIDVHAMLHPKELYYTPGLWEMTGSEFWRAFWFETPFALGRGFLWAVYPLGMLVYLYLFIRNLIAAKRQRYRGKE